MATSRENQKTAIQIDAEVNSQTGERKREREREREKNRRWCSERGHGMRQQLHSAIAATISRTHECTNPVGASTDDSSESHGEAAGIALGEASPPSREATKAGAARELLVSERAGNGT